MKLSSLLVIGAMALSSLTVQDAVAKVKLPKLFQSGMVLQRNQDIPVWGTADAGETVNVTFRGKTYTATAGTDGKWRVNLPKQKPGGPFEMKVNDENLTDVMVGDVWLVSGQSNIDIHIERIYPQYAADIDAYKNDNIRIFQVATTPKTTPQTDVVTTGWKHLTKENAWHFSSIGYFLGQHMQKATGIPQGVIQCSQGGTPIQSWFELDSLKAEKFGAMGQEWYTKFFLYTDPAYVQAQTKANNIASDVWTNKMNETDPGYNKFEKPDYDDSAWEVYDQYDNNKWARHNGRPITGSMWLRQHIHVDAAHAGKEATLHLGTLHDMDYTYVNGMQVGVTYYQYPPRRYKIPAGLLHEGDNVITVRIICKYGQANFFKNKPHEILFGDDQPVLYGKSETETSGSHELSPIILSTKWKTHVGSLIGQGALGGKVDTQNQASVLYNGMLRPLAPYALQGIVWYQGESNTGDPNPYGEMLKTMMSNWRTIWERPDMPFNIVQLANHMEPTDQPQNSGWAVLREQQRQVAANDANALLTVNIDLGEASDIHPLRKRDVAERVALGLENQVLGKKNVLYPEVVSAAWDAKSEEGKIIIAMDKPLTANAELFEFEVKGNDGKFHNVKASCDTKQVTILTSGVNIKKGDKTVIRYAWKNNPAKANLRGKNDLPASPFELKVEN